MISIDGTIVAGIASIDQHMLTGESQPADKEIGDPVFASTMVVSGRIAMTVERAGQDTVAARIGTILQQTADFKLSIQSRGERVADITAPPTLLLGALALPLLGVEAALAVLFSSLGYNMRIIAPLSLLNYLQITAHSGILIKDGRSLELLKKVDTVVFDKTGTLTLEQPNVCQIYSWNGYTEEQLLTYAAAAEYKQTHPIARAILQKARNEQLSLPDIHDAHYEVGYGIKVRTEERLIRVGSDRFMQMEGIPLTHDVAEQEAACHVQGHSLVLVAVDDHLAGAIELQPTIRPEAPMIVQHLHAMGMQTYIISGDQAEPTRKMAQRLGIDHYFANTLPEHKAQMIKQLQDEGTFGGVLVGVWVL
ncbi:MAG: HAD-IC family P-type ATPase, partial [Chloroflexaceae bacterium]|nr:HAD-IC family P-type ATPase [Chloroflexaceae bacterium]